MAAGYSVNLFAVKRDNLDICLGEIKKWSRNNIAPKTSLVSFNKSGFIIVSTLI